MKADQNRVVVDMPNAYVTEDGEQAVMVLKNSDRSIQTVRFSPHTMMQFVSKLFELFLNQKIQKEAREGLAVVQPIAAVRAMAPGDIHHKAVILQFRLQNGLAAPFAVALGEAEELYKQLGDAINRIRTPLPDI